MTETIDNNDAIHIVGAGLAGSEAAWQAANAGAPVVLHEMRPKRGTEAHQTGDFAELVCSNSFRSDDADMNAVGQLHHEMRAMDSLIMASADIHKVPAGSALAVDRDGFSAEITAKIRSHPLITVVEKEIPELPPSGWKNVIIATGPLTSPGLATAIAQITGEDQLAFFDAIAPIVYKDTIDFDKAWFQSRYDKGSADGAGDYINCPLDRDQYAAFIDALIEGEKTTFKEWEKTPYFDGCLPIEVMAERGAETLRHGPMKPFGLTNPHDPQTKAYAVVQLRQDNALGTLYNMVGFQTKLKHGAQTEIFRTIPGLERAEFARLGGLHRNTYLNSPRLLDTHLRLKAEPRLRFAGQITGCEGYVESTAVGLIAGKMAAAQYFSQEISVPPATTSIGALLNHITGGHLETIDAGPRSYQPMNVNFGLFPPVEFATKSPEGKRLRGPEKGKARKRALTARAKTDLAAWLANQELTREPAA